MDAEQYNAARLMVCTAWITIRGLGGDRPDRVPNDADMADHYAWCAGKWEELERDRSDHPDAVAQRALFRDVEPSPSAIQYWRDYSARHGDLDYERIKEWWSRVERSRGNAD